jgi:hypothetical protein
MATNAEDEILERASLTRELIADLPLISRVVDGASRAWEVNHSAPGSNDQKVQSIFAADADGAPGDVHVYAVSMTSDIHARYTVNRHDAGSMREAMSNEALLDEVAAEMMALAIDKGVLDECPDEECGGVNPAEAAECATCGKKLEVEEEESEPVASVDGQAATVEKTPTAPVAET